MKALHPSDARVVAGYQLIARLGAGGMGQVFIAVSPAGRLVALKVILPSLADQPEFRVRFRREVTAARAVQGPYIAEVLDADPDGDPPWLATQYIGGPSLAHAVLQCGPLPPATVTALGAAATEALMAVARAGLVHRDLKPANVLLDDDGPRIIDFGIAKAAEASHLTQTGVLVGTPGFMAPEQISGAPLSAAADVFSLGAVLAFALAGAGPFGDGPAAALLGRVLYQDPDLTRLPAEWRETIRLCLAKDPADRPALPALRARLVPDGRPVTDLFGAGWLPEPVRAYVEQRTAVVKQHTAAFQAGRVSIPVPPPTPPPTAIPSWPGAGYPTGTSTGFRRRRRLWPVAAAAFAAAVLAIPLVVALLTRDAPGDGGSPGGTVAGQESPAAESPAPLDALPEPYAGVWTGGVYQSDVDSTYPVLVALGPGEVGSVVGSVRYWTLQCSGELQLDAVTGEHIRVTERITDGLLNCLDGTPLEFQLEDEETLRYHAYPDNPEQVRVDGSLGASTDRLPDRFVGTWQGTVHQYDTDEDYPVEFTVEGATVGERAGTIDYPSLECGGELRLEQIEGDVAWFTETITRDERFLGCVSTGAVALTVTGDGEASFQWHYLDDSELGEPNVEGPVG